MPRPLLITTGDPCGIGPEVILKALREPLRPRIPVIVIGTASVFERAAARFKLPLPGRFIDVAVPGRFVPGRSSARAGEASAAYLDVAIGLIRRGAASGLVTAPVTKWAVQRARGHFEGHTEYLSKALRSPRVVMMFASDRLRVALVTRHLPLREVPRRMSAALVRQTVRITAKALRAQFGIRNPKLVMCGLNPHAGEAGLLGQEDRRVIEPALRACRKQGIRVEGPVAADGLFGGGLEHDAVIACYHDQGLIPFKLLNRDQGCQLTLGLPCVRTSPDHGSALDIAGKGLADPGSMRYALRLASQLCTR